MNLVVKLFNGNNETPVASGDRCAWFPLERDRVLLTVKTSATAKFDVLGRTGAGEEFILDSVDITANSTKGVSIDAITGLEISVRTTVGGACIKSVNVIG